MHFVSSAWIVRKGCTGTAFYSWKLDEAIALTASVSGPKINGPLYDWNRRPIRCVDNTKVIALRQLWLQSNTAYITINQPCYEAVEGHLLVLKFVLPCKGRALLHAGN
jgi:hypothetical protein